MSFSNADFPPPIFPSLILFSLFLSSPFHFLSLNLNFLYFVLGADLVRIYSPGGLAAVTVVVVVQPRVVIKQ